MNSTRNKKIEISLAMFPEYRQKHLAKRLPCIPSMCATEPTIPFRTLLSIVFDFFNLFLTTNLPRSQSTVYNFSTSSTESPVFFAMTSMGISDCLRFLAISRLSCAAPMASPSANPCLWPSLRPSSRKDA